MKKVSNKLLISILVILAAAFVLSRFFHSPGQESNLRKGLVKLDTARISEVRILPSSHREEEIKLVREGYRWKVTLGKQEAETDAGLVKSMLGMLVSVEAQRRVSHKKEKWEEFNVGEKGTRISVFENSSKKADFLVGKTGFAPATGGGFAGGYTYFRLADENDVYAVDGFLESGFDRAFNDWRNKAFLRFRRGDVNKIFFNYPSDTGFVVEKRDSIWFIAHLGVNPSAMENYLNQISDKNLNEFAEGFVPPGQADVNIQISRNAGTAERVEGWKQDGKWILTSTLQRGIYFSSPESAAKSILIGKQKLLESEKK